MKPPVDRRQGQRYPIVVPITWPGGEGITREISTSGVYFITSQVVPAGQTLRLSFVLPRQSIPLNASGVVVRVEPAGERVGVAVRLEELMPP